MKEECVIVWKSKYLYVEYRLQNYEIAVLPIFTYAVETSPNKYKTKPLLGTIEIEIQRTMKRNFVLIPSRFVNCILKVSLFFKHTRDFIPHCIIDVLP